MQLRYSVKKKMWFPGLQKCLTAFVMVGFAATMSAQSDLPPTEPNWKQVCEQALARPHTPPPFAHAETEDQLKKCDSKALYYGFSGSPDFSAALQCAYYERAHPDSMRGDPFPGPGVLAMLYANGKGVQRSYDVAIRFACENPWAAEAEQEYRIGHLQQLRDSHAVANFDLCDDGLSGLTEGACEFVQQGFADAKRQRELEAISSGWSPEVKAAFKLLQEAEHEFEAARVGYEVDISGTGRAAFSLAEQGRLRDQFLTNLKRFAKGDIPLASEADEQGADHRLNAVYREIQQSPENSWQYVTIKPSGIRNTERKWLTLRNAWIEFSRLAYPSLTKTRVVTQITRLRVHQLQSLTSNR